jgi:hypothetical protein
LRLLSDVWALYLPSEAFEECFEPNLKAFEPSDSTLLATAKKAISATGC